MRSMYPSCTHPGRIAVLKATIWPKNQQYINVGHDGDSHKNDADVGVYGISCCLLTAAYCSGVSCLFLVH